MTVMGHRKEFLSTPSARRATQTGRDVFRWWMISIHALREEGDRHCPRPRLVEVISIHALREEGDFWWADVPRICIEFLSTPSARRATRHKLKAVRPSKISIHALREEGDPSVAVTSHSPSWDFYPRPPRGGRQPRPRHTSARPHISIHALREEGDKLSKNPKSAKLHFYPRPPRGGRRIALMQASGDNKISIHALREEGDLNGGKHFAFAIISIHALREEGDDRAVVRDHECRGFLSTPSARRATSTLVFSL